MAKTWPLREHTEGKHLVLRHYLQGWLRILGRSHGQLVFIDGFAGPGEYDDGEPGSPAIVLDCVRELRAKHSFGHVQVRCLFIESDVATANHLSSVLGSRYSGLAPTHEVRTGSFEDEVASLLDWVDGQAHTQLAPAFVMVDPFGPKGVRMEFIQRILSNNKSECMISFMYEPINRRKKLQEFQHHLDELYGSPEWRQSLTMSDHMDARKTFLHDFFTLQLKRHGARHVVPFGLWRGNRHIYTLFFASGSAKGCDLMKQCMWKVDRSGVTLFAASRRPVPRCLR